MQEIWNLAKEMKQLLIEINKLIGETGTLRDEATLEHIVLYPNELVGDIARLHPFVDGNKRTSFLCWYLDVNPDRRITKGMITSAVNTTKVFLDALKRC